MPQAIWWAVVTIVAIHCSIEIEAIGLSGDVFLLEEDGSALVEIEPASSFVQTAAGSAGVPGSAGAAGSAAGSSAFNPQPLKKPYHKHMKHNADMWSSLGGWTHQMEAQVTRAKQDLNLANMYAKTKHKEKEISELGCPCEGEKYHDLVFQNAGKLSKLEGFAAGSGAGSAMEFLSGAGGSGRKSKGQGDEIDSKEFKRMLKKYGKLGPNSTWQPKHDKKKKRAKQALKRAELVENAAFKTALPEFRKLKEDDPAFFSNGKCQCPEGWTLQDAAALAAKQSKDTEEEYWTRMRQHRANLAQMSGEAERIAAQEAAGEPPDHEMP